jgi:hypothetical protein
VSKNWNLGPTFCKSSCSTERAVWWTGMNIKPYDPHPAAASPRFNLPCTAQQLAISVPFLHARLRNYGAGPMGARIIDTDGKWRRIPECTEWAAMDVVPGIGRVVSPPGRSDRCSFRARHSAAWVAKMWTLAWKSLLQRKGTVRGLWYKDRSFCRVR